MSDNKFDKLIDKIDVLIRLFAIYIVKDKNKTEIISTLLGSGIDTKIIAEIAKTTPESVRGIKSRLGKKEKEKVELKSDNKQTP